jgi:hypothetical protein
MSYSFVAVPQDAAAMVSLAPQAQVRPDVDDLLPPRENQRFERRLIAIGDLRLRSGDGVTTRS